MFGYVVINKPDLRIRDFEKYRAYYCGLCTALKQGYGIKGQITLNYDLTFLAILLNGLYETETQGSMRRCIAHPFEKHPILMNECTGYAADMNILLTYFKCIDDWQDEKKLKGKAFAGILKRSAERVILKYPDKAKVISEELKKLSVLEAEGSKDIDAVSGCFGRLMAALFVYKHDEWEPYLSKMGFYLGKYIYILDAFNDLEEDEKKGRYNPLKEKGKDAGYCRDMLTMMMSECSKAFEMLPIVSDFDILENIIYSGVWCGFNEHGPAKASVMSR